MPVEKGVDVSLATKMFSLANDRTFEAAILIAPDKDYLETVRAVTQVSLRVDIVAWRGTIPPEMEAESSRPVIYFEDFQPDIEMVEAPDTEAEILTEAKSETASRAAEYGATADRLGRRLLSGRA